MANTTSDFNSLKSVSRQSWNKLAGKKIFFGHQSVGGNIIDGVNDLMAEFPQIDLDVVQINKPEDFTKSPAFFHAWLGENTNPETKINEFMRFIKKGLGNKADYAFFKFCFVDFSGQTNVPELFSNYRNAMASLKQSYPQTTFIHVTVPLVSQEKGLKDWLKKILGRSIKDPGANLMRNRFNDMMISEYMGREPIFDLARIESTYPGGKREFFPDAGNRNYSLINAYTDDGGHLSRMSSKMIAAELLRLLAEFTD